MLRKTHETSSDALSFRLKLFLKQPRSSSVCAVTFCDVFELSKGEQSKGIYHYKTFLLSSKPIRNLCYHGKGDLYNEIRRRDIDLQGVLKIFADVHDKVTRRNSAVHENLSASKQPGTKLNKMIDTSDEATEKRAVMSIFLPGSLFRFCFDILSMLLTIYFSVMVLYRAAFRAEGEGRVVLFDIMADMFFICDCYLRSSHFAFMRHGSLCTDRKLILQQYMKNGLTIDAVSCLSILEIFTPMQQLRLVCLLRLVRIPSFFDKIHDHLSLRGMRISLATKLLGKILYFYFIANHWVACIWFIIHRYIERNVKVTWATSDCPWETQAGTEGCLATWDEALGEHNICSLDSMNDCYLRSLYFSLTTLVSIIRHHCWTYSSQCDMY